MKDLIDRSKLVPDICDGDIDFGRTPVHYSADTIKNAPSAKDDSYVWACAVKNSVALICWASLAIIFDQWWILFFAIMFQSSMRSEPSRKKEKDHGSEK